MQDPASHQLEIWADDHKDIKSHYARHQDGIAYKNLTSVLTVGPNGPPLLQDRDYLHLMQNFVRKNIPARIVHAKGTGCHGYFELTNPDISKYSKACIFQKVGKKIELFARFGFPDQDERPDTSRTVWTWSLKLYTEEGNQDFTCLNSPVFHVRDPKDFFNSIRSRTFNPQSPTGFWDSNMTWDFATGSPEATHFFLTLHSDRGQPFSPRFVNAFPVNIFRLVNKEGEFVYARFTFQTNQGVRYMSNQEAAVIRKKDPDFATRDLYNAISRKDYPSFTWYVQIMTPEEVPKYVERNHWNPFDNTKVWPHAQHPLIEIGKIVFNRNMDNFSNESGLSAFNPASLIPGIEAAMEDKVFLGRVFAYEDSQLYRIGSNKFQVPINQPKALKGDLKTYASRCPMNFSLDNFQVPNYYPNSRGGPIPDEEAKKLQGQRVDEEVLKIYENAYTDNFGQPRMLYNDVMKEGERQRTAESIMSDIVTADKRIQEAVVKLFSNVSPDLGKRIQGALDSVK